MTPAMHEKTEALGKRAAQARDVVTHLYHITPPQRMPDVQPNITLLLIVADMADMLIDVVKTLPNGAAPR